MSNMTVRRGALAALGAAAGALATAAFVSSTPIASADDNDFALPALADVGLPAPAVPTDSFTYTDETIIGEGSQTVTYETVFNGTGTPVTTTTTDVLPAGDTDYGYSTIDTSTLTLGADTWTTAFESTALESTTAAGSSFEFVTPLFETVGSF